MKGQRLRQLQAAIAAIEGGVQGGSRTGAGASQGVFQDWIDRPGLHEWFVTDDGASGWFPPVGVLLHLARRRLDVEEGRWLVWIGRCCWPYLLGFQGFPGRFRQVIFVDPPDDASRLWAIDLATRCPAVAAVVADGSGLDMAATRRLQLAAESGSVPVLCARPLQDRERLSAATTRWLVRCAPSQDDGIPRWTVELLRCKGVQPTRGLRTPGGSVLDRTHGQRWTVEWKCAQGGVALPAALVDRSCPAAKAGAEEEVRRSA